MNDIGFFYIRENIYWNTSTENYYKTGITQNIKNRECPYRTTERTHGTFIKVIELSTNKKKLHIIVLLKIKIIITSTIFTGFIHIFI